MKKRDFKYSVLRVCARQLQGLVDFMIVQTKEEEDIAGGNPASSEVTLHSTTDTALGMSLPSSSVAAREDDSTSQDTDEISASWITDMDADQPPAHWLRRVQQGSPELLKQIGSPHQQSTSRPRTLPTRPADTPLHISEIQLSRSTNMALEAKEQSVQQVKPRYFHNQANKVNNLPNPNVGNDHTDARSLDGTANPAEIQVPLHVSEILLSGSTNKALEAKRQSAQQVKPPYFHNQTNSVNNLPNPNVGNDHTDDRLPDGKWVRTANPAEIQMQTREPVKVGEPLEMQMFSSNVLSHPLYPWPTWNSPEKIYHNHESSHQRFIKPPPDSPLTQPETHWPTLPDEKTTEHQEWEMIRRVWERQQRLNEEQRGNIWNA